MVKLTIIDGTPEEVIAVANGLKDGDDAAPIDTPVAPLANVPPEDKVFASTDVARRVFNRRPLSVQQKLLISTLGKAYPGWVPATTLQSLMSYSTSQFAGMMGAFGRRFSHTEGHVEGSWLFDAVWNHDTSCYDYRLSDTVYEAAKAENLI